MTLVLRTALASYRRIMIYLVRYNVRVCTSPPLGCSAETNPNECGEPIQDKVAQGTVALYTWFVRHSQPPGQLGRKTRTDNQAAETGKVGIPKKGTTASAVASGFGLHGCVCTCT